jgi:hypothetical protein
MRTTKYIKIIEDLMKIEFRECDICGNRPNHVDLCSGCTHNSKLIDLLKENLNFELNARYVSENLLTKAVTVAEQLSKLNQIRKNVVGDISGKIQHPLKVEIREVMKNHKKNEGKNK